MKRWLVNVLALWVVDQLMTTIWIKDLLLLALVFSIIQAFLKPVLQILVLPITILTLGLAYWVVNATLLYLAFTIGSTGWYRGFGSLMLASLIISIVNSFFETK